jgi:cobalt/nickel transport system ATP-binding protein
LDIVVKNLRFKRGTFLLDVEEFTVSRGEKIAVLGLNGSGKTTFFDCLLGLHDYDGDVRILDKCPKKHFKQINPHIAYCMQNPDDQLFCLTVREDLLFAPRNFGLLEKQTEESIISSTNELIDVTDLLDKAPHELSYGEKKRCVIASCLSYSPKILLLDEPTAMLDHEQKDNLKKVILGIKDTTILIASHDYDWVRSICGRELMLKDGTAVLRQ